MRTKLLLTAMAAFAALWTQAHAAEKPNVLIVLADDMGYGDLSIHGNPVLETPALDRLARQSVRLTDFHTAPICTPTRSQLLTGMDALRNGAYVWAYSREMIRPEVPTIADLFAANGYMTGHFGKWHLGDVYPYRPQDRGFQETVHHKGAAINQSPDYWHNDCFDDTYWHNEVPKQYEGYCTDVWFDESMKFMQKAQEAGKPFFIYLPTNVPHTPLYVQKNYEELFPDHARPYDPDEDPDAFENMSVAAFFGMMVNLDENMARLDEFLREKKLHDDTIVIFMSDNGGTAGTKVFNAGMRGRKASLYDGGHRAPCFIRWPNGKLRPAADLGQLTQSQDLLPTLAELCELKSGKPLDVDGVSLAPLLRGQALDLSRRMLPIYFAKSPTAQKDYGWAVLWNQWRLIMQDGKRELYDLGSDPAQERDLLARYPDIAEQMGRYFDQWWDDSSAAIGTIPHLPIGAPQQNPVEMTCFDWYGATGTGNVTVQRGIRMGIPAFGYWNFEVVADGRYEFALRRWHEAADAPLSAGVPEHRFEAGSYPAGKALPIAEAVLEFDGKKHAKKVSATDTKATFTLDLKAGTRAKAVATFLDKDGHQLCGTYYLYVTRLE